MIQKSAFIRYLKPAAVAVLPIMVATWASTVSAQQRDFSNVEVKTTQLTDGVYMLTGAGGNIGVSVGEDGVFMIDDQFAPLSDKISAAIAELTDEKVTYLLNTHWHGDHTGGNENFGSNGAVIVSHANVRARMSTKQFMKAFGREVPAAPQTALPDITYSNDATFHFNDTEIRLIHTPQAHTDGDSLVFFTEADVLHTGDTFFNGMFPFIDQGSGGTLDGIIASVDKALSLAGDNTKIIPGHGPLATRNDLLEYQTMLKQVKEIMTAAATSGKTRNEVVAGEPLKALGEKWGKGFMKTDVFTGIVFDVMTGS